MGIRISSLSANALPYTGREQIPVVQNATTRSGTLSSFVNYLSGDFAFVNRPNTFIGSQTIQGNLSVLGNQTIQGNLSVQRTLSATTVEAVSARFDFVDIKQFEASGFDIKGNLNVIGRLSATDIVNFNSGLTARDAVLFDVDTSAPALEITQRGPGFSLLVEDEASDTTPFAITGSGNVGVGTSTPNEKLTVFGNLSVSGTLSASMIEAISSRITYLDIREYELSGFRATGPVTIETNSSNTTLRITQSGSGDVIRVEDSHAIDMTPFIVKGDGKVGIGVSTPNELLTVAGNISAYGSIFAFNTISTLSGNSTNWNSVFATVSTLSASWEESADILPTVTNFLSTNNVLISSATVTTNISARGSVAASQSIIPVTVTNLNANRLFTEADTNKIFHFDTTSSALTASFPGVLSDGFNAAIMNTGTNYLYISSNIQYNAVGNKLSDRYSGAYVYKSNSNIFAVGGV